MLTQKRHFVVGVAKAWILYDRVKSTSTGVRSRLAIGQAGVDFAALDAAYRGIGSDIHHAERFEVAHLSISSQRRVLQDVCSREVRCCCLYDAIGVLLRAHA